MINLLQISLGPSLIIQAILNSSAVRKRILDVKDKRSVLSFITPTNSAVSVPAER